jgi:hypothetical protein
MMYETTGKMNEMAGTIDEILALLQTLLDQTAWVWTNALKSYSRVRLETTVA